MLQGPEGYRYPEGREADPEPAACGSDEWFAWHQRITVNTDGVCGALDCPVCCALDADDQEP